MIAQQARLGNITEASLSDSIARFKQSVNSFRKENKINYDIVDSELNVDGEDGSGFESLRILRHKTNDRVADTVIGFMVHLQGL